MTIRLKSVIALSVLLAGSVMTGCEDGKSYAEMLTDENKAVNLFLVNQRVVGGISADNDFEVGENAPFYQLDEDGNIYMKVLEKGTEGVVEEGDQVLFRFLRTNLMYYNPSVALSDLDWEGNADNPVSNTTSFLYGDYSLPSSAQWGSAIQLPMKYLQFGSKVYLVVKSQYGWSDEITYVQPYLYQITYNKRQS